MKILCGEEMKGKDRIKERIKEEKKNKSRGKKIRKCKKED